MATLTDDEKTLRGPMPLADLPKPSTVAQAVNTMFDNLTPSERADVATSASHAARLAHIKMIWPTLDAQAIVNGLIPRAKTVEDALAAQRAAAEDVAKEAAKENPAPAPAKPAAKKKG